MSVLEMLLCRNFCKEFVTDWLQVGTQSPLVQVGLVNPVTEPKSKPNRLVLMFSDSESNQSLLET